MNRFLDFAAGIGSVYAVVQTCIPNVKPDSHVDPNGPLKAVVSERQGGSLKPYGVFYTLWKAYILPPCQTQNVPTRRIEQNDWQEPHRPQDWLETSVEGRRTRSRL